MPEHEVFVPPDNRNVKIWRYMDFTKFVSMLEHRGLYFPRADQLGDPFEGSVAKRNLLTRPEYYKDVMHATLLEQLSVFQRQIITVTWVSCWHMNGYESAAMWKLYANANQDEAIAIQSTYSQLEAALSVYDEIYIGVVRYIDYDTDIIPPHNTLFPLIHKRKSFEYEHEVRAVI
jgi:hypothetical protein